MTARRALPPIRTFTVGPGISPGQPAAGCGRVADYNRRFGITPTPECAAAGTRSLCHGGQRAIRVTSVGRLTASSGNIQRPDGSHRVGPDLLTHWSSPLNLCVTSEERSRVCAHPVHRTTHPLCQLCSADLPRRNDTCCPPPAREPRSSQPAPPSPACCSALSPRPVAAAADQDSCRPDGLYETPGVDVPVLLRLRHRRPREDGRRPPAARHRLLHELAYRQGRQAGLPRLGHPVGQGHPPELRVRARRRRQQDLRGRGQPRQRLHRDDLAGRRGSRDGPRPPLQGPLQPAQQVQEAAPGREDPGLRGRLGRDRRLLRRRAATGWTPAASTRWPPTPTAR